MTSSHSPAFHIVESAPAATWAEARKLVEKVRTGARAWLELGEVLEQLRAEFLRQGSGRRTDLQPTPHDAAKVEQGWQAKVRHELGISDDTARRWMLDGQRHRQLLQIADGATQVDGKKVTAEVREKAKEALESIQLDPTVRPARVWAGVWGATATAGKQRAAVDHARNIARGLTALATSLPHWASLTPDERAALEKGWAQVRELLPPTFKQ